MSRFLNALPKTVTSNSLASCSFSIIVTGPLMVGIVGKEENLGNQFDAVVVLCGIVGSIATGGRVPMA